jgi:hypothetical protein
MLDGQPDAHPTASGPAARRGRGIWAYTDWDAVAEQRSEQRREGGETPRHHRHRSAASIIVRASALVSAQRILSEPLPP